MSITIVVPEGTPYVVAAMLSTALLLQFQATKVSGARKRSGIKYPQMYAEQAQVQASREALIFNCAQRAHQNTLENIPVVLLSTAATSISYPILGAALCGAWTFGRILYTLGYITGEPAKRNTRGGAIGAIAQLGLLLASTYSVFGLVRNNV